jgi:hypothetical protein
MLDYTCAVSTPVQYACGELLKTKLGKPEKSAEDIALNKKWEAGIAEVYSGVMEIAKTLFVPESGFTFVSLPAGMEGEKKEREEGRRGQSEEGAKEEQGGVRE